ncbi:MAG: hypothetical protein IPG76_01805 [Acidobacteria bacterium]|nr:hypothetical protein [Acidobacteriota bacterium]
MSEYVGHGLETVIKAQEQWLDEAAKQNTKTIHAIKEALKLEETSGAAALADFAEQAVNNYFEVQKRWLELAIQLPFMHSTTPKEAEKKAHK